RRDGDGGDVELGGGAARRLGGLPRDLNPAARPAGDLRLAVFEGRAGADLDAAGVEHGAAGRDAGRLQVVVVREEVVHPERDDVVGAVPGHAGVLEREGRPDVEAGGVE